MFSCVYQTILAALNEQTGVMPPEEQDLSEIMDTPEKNVATLSYNRQHEEKMSSNSDADIKTLHNNDSMSLPYKLPIDERQAVQRLAEKTDESGSANEPVPIPEPIAFPTLRATDSLMKASELRDARVIGTLFNTYILLEMADELILIDQHAAHEKIIYERLRNASRQERGLLVQPLLAPQTIPVTPAERVVIESEQAFFESIGFTLEAFGHRSVILRSIPDLQSAKIDPEMALRTALQVLVKDHPTNPGAIDELLYTVACKAAVKAHDRLSLPEINQLIADLAPLENPYTCPHGRPVIIRQSKLEFEKKFKRVL